MPPCGIQFRRPVPCAELASFASDHMVSQGLHTSSDGFVAGIRLDGCACEDAVLVGRPPAGCGGALWALQLRKWQVDFATLCGLL